MRLANNLAEANENLEDIIKKLAKDDYWQSIYVNLKNPFELFENKGDFTNLQLMFIAFLSFYNTIHTDVIMGDVPKLVWEKSIYQDAYMKYRSKKMYKDKESNDYSNSSRQRLDNRQNNFSKNKKDEKITYRDKVIFNRKKK